MSKFTIGGSTENSFLRLDSSELRGILEKYRASLTRPGASTNPFCDAERDVVNRLLQQVNVIDFKSGANSPVTRKLPGSSLAGRTAYAHVLLSAIANPNSSTFTKLAFLLEAELRTAVLFQDLVALKSAPPSSTNDSGADTVMTTLRTALPLLNTAGNCPPASMLVDLAKRARKPLNDPALVAVYDLLLAALKDMNQAEAVFKKSEFADVFARCPRTTALLQGTADLTQPEVWLDLNRGCRATLSEARPLLANVSLPPALSHGKESMEMVVQRGWHVLPFDHSLALRLAEPDSVQDWAAVDTELAVLFDAPTRARAAATRFVHFLAASVDTYLSAHPLDNLIRLYGVQDSLAAAHEFDVLQGSILGRRGLQFEDSFLTDHIAVLIDQVLAPSCRVETGLSAADAVAWCTWCLQGRAKGEAEPACAQQGHAREQLPLYRLAAGVQMMEQRPAFNGRPARVPENGADTESPATTTDAPDGARPADASTYANGPAAFATRGELDGLVWDERTGDALFMVEVKLNIVDIGKAHAQREKTFRLLDAVWGVVGAQADPNGQSLASAKAAQTPAQPPVVELWFSETDHRSCDMLRRHFSSASRESRWVYTTQVGVSEESWKSVCSLPAAGSVRHVLEQCLASAVGSTAQHFYGHFARAAFPRVWRLSPPQRAGHVARWLPADAPRTDSFQLFRDMLLSSAFCREATEPLRPYGIPFVPTGNNGTDPTPCGASTPSAGSGCYLSSARVLDMLREQANSEWNDESSRGCVSFGYPIYETLTYDTGLTYNKLFYYQKRCCDKKGNRPVDLVMVVQELVNLGCLRCLLILFL